MKKWVKKVMRVNFDDERIEYLIKRTTKEKKENSDNLDNNENTRK